MYPRVLVIAKTPAPGRSKTRLCPPCTPEQAAELAEAALADTLEAVKATDCASRRIVLDGEPGDWLPEGFEVRAQAGGGLGDRLAAAFSGCEGPTLLIGMDTPQVKPMVLEQSLETLQGCGVDTVLGLSGDGGYWAIGMKGHHPGAFDGVPMSKSNTGERQESRLRELGLSVAALPVLDDVDFFPDARRAAAAHPDGHFARLLTAMGPAFA